MMIYCVGSEEQFAYLGAAFDADDDFINRLFLGVVDNILSRGHTAYEEFGFTRETILVKHLFGQFQIFGGMFNFHGVSDASAGQRGYDDHGCIECSGVCFARAKASLAELDPS